jgi:myo-inositol-1(or 4)-monophosphatase
MNTSELERILATTRRAAHEAAELVRGGFRKHPVIEHKGAVDLVTSYDRNSETLLRDRLGSLGIDIVGEEQGGTSRTGTPTFFIDPIDGTTNFVHGHPFWCVSIGLVVDGQPILGIVVAPSLGLEWYGYLAADGKARAVRRAWGSARARPDAGTDVDADPDAAQEEPCAVSPMTRFEDSLLATGFPYDRATSSENNFDAFVAIKKKCQAVRRCGSAALDLCLVADGTYEGYWERKLGPWDMAGGMALVRAAGGRVSEYGGGERSITTGNLVATNGHIHDALLAHLASVSAPHGQPPPP